MKKVLSCSIWAVVILLLPFGSSVHGKALFTKHFQQTLFDVTAHAAYSVEVLLDDSEYNIGKNVVGIVVHDSDDSDVEKAELVITQRNLVTGDNAPGVIEVRERGEGLYIVSGLDLRREGQWELSIVVKKKGIEDRVKFVLPAALKERVPKGKYSP